MFDDRNLLTIHRGGCHCPYDRRHWCPADDLGYQETAIADHWLKGRLFVGMARSYQARGQSILGQRVGGHLDRIRPKSDADQRNRLLVSESFEIMMAAWKQDLLTCDGPTYQIPYPRRGIPNWPPAETITGRYGAPGEVDDEGTVKAVSVEPRPYTSPHPQLFRSVPALARSGGAGKRT